MLSNKQNFDIFVDLPEWIEFEDKEWPFMPTRLTTEFPTTNFCQWQKLQIIVITTVTIITNNNVVQLFIIIITEHCHLRKIIVLVIVVIMVVIIISRCLYPDNAKILLRSIQVVDCKCRTFQTFPVYAEEFCTDEIFNNYNNKNIHVYWPAHW